MLSTQEIIHFSQKAIFKIALLTGEQQQLLLQQNLSFYRIFHRSTTKATSVAIPLMQPAPHYVMPIGSTQEKSTASSIHLGSSPTIGAALIVALKISMSPNL
jgi:hypothetical protein